MSTTTIPLAAIVANADQPRKIFDAAPLADLAASIEASGLQQPITVRPIPPRPDGAAYEIVMGERRFRAHGLLVARGLAQFASIACHVVEMDVITRDIAAIVENLQRADIKPMEEARAFARMLAHGLSVVDLGKKLGMKQAWRITERMELLKLTPQLQTLTESGNLPVEMARWIATVPHDKQAHVAQMVARGQLTGTKAVRAACEAINQELSQTDIFGDSAPKVSEADVATVNAMEAKIESIARLAALGFKDGECIVATKVSRDRARLMADKLTAIQSALLHMDRQLRQAAARVDAILPGSIAA